MPVPAFTCSDPVTFNFDISVSATAPRVADGDAAVYISEMVGDIDSNPVTPPDLVLPNDLRNGPLYNLIYQTMELSDTQVAETSPCPAPRRCGRTWS